MRQRILVTGGAGFIGSHLCRRLLDEDNEVVCLDNLFTGDKQNIAALRSDPRFRLVIHDIIDPFFIDNVDAIYNLACPASPPHYQFNAIRTIKANTIGMIHMLGLAKKHRVPLLQASTSEVYGDPEQHPQTESYRGNVNPLGIRACYDEGKRVAETLCFDYHRQHHIPVRVVRIFNTYGPHMHPDDGRVVSNFIVQALQGKDLTVYGDGSQTRSFCYVSDLVEGFLRMMASGFTGPINLGNPGEFTILELAEMVLRKTGSRARVVFRPLPLDDPTRRKPDISLAIQELGWSPSVPLEEGIDLTIRYFQNKMALGC